MTFIIRNGLLSVSLITLTFLTFLMVTSKEVFSAEIRTHISEPGGGLKSIVIEGEIMKGDYKRFIKKINQNNGKISNVYIFSPGGNFSEAIKIGRAIRKLELTTVVPSQSEDGQPLCDSLKTFRNFVTVPKDYNCICAGSCFFIFIGGVNRAGGHIVVHRPYFDKNEFGQLSEEDARNKFIARQKFAREYMQEMGVPKHIQDKILGTRPEKAMELDYKTVRTYFHGDIPYRHEWRQAKCAEVKDDKNINDCYVAVDKERRRAAYEKFFRK